MSWCGDVAEAVSWLQENGVSSWVGRHGGSVAIAAEIAPSHAKRSLVFGVVAFG
jgi:hypothetical protein